MEKKVGIIISIYNSENYLNLCIKSALEQTYKNIHIYLVNDGSTDRSADICNKFEHDNSKISAISLQNSGVSHARNIGIKEAHNDKCDYVMFLDSDDYIDKDVVKELISHQSNDTLMGIRVKRFGIENEKVMDEGAYDSNDFIRKMLLGKTHGYIVPYLFDMKNVQKHKISFREDIEYLEDMQFLIAYLKKLNIKTIRFIDSEALYYYRVNQSSATMSYDTKRAVSNIFKSLDLINENTARKFNQEIINSKLLFLERKLEQDGSLGNLSDIVDLIKNKKAELKWHHMTLRSRTIYMILNSNNKKMVKIFYGIKNLMKHSRGGYER